MPHQQIDHVRRQAQIVRQSQQHPHIRGGEALAQLLFHLRRQQPEFLAALQTAGDVVPLVAGFFVGRLRDLLRRRGQKPQLPQRQLRRFDPVSVPPQLAGQRPGLHIAVVPQERQIQKRRVAVSPLQQPLDRLRRQGYGFVRRMDQNTCHDAPPFRFSVEKLLPASPLFLLVFYSTRIFPQQQGGQRRVVNFFVF